MFDNTDHSLSWDSNISPMSPAYLIQLHMSTGEDLGFLKCARKVNRFLKAT